MPKLTFSGIFIQDVRTNKKIDIVKQLNDTEFRTCSVGYLSPSKFTTKRITCAEQRDSIKLQF